MISNLGMMEMIVGIDIKSNIINAFKIVNVLLKYYILFCLSRSSVNKATSTLCQEAFSVGKESCADAISNL